MYPRGILATRVRFLAPEKLVSSPPPPETYYRTKQLQYQSRWIDSILCRILLVLRNKAYYSQNMLPPVSQGLVLCCVFGESLPLHIVRVASNDSITQSSQIKEGNTLIQQTEKPLANYLDYMYLIHATCFCYGLIYVVDLNVL